MTKFINKESFEDIAAPGVSQWRAPCIRISVFYTKHIDKIVIGRGGGACLKLGAQITYDSLKSGCAESVIYLIEARKVQMHNLAH